MRVVINFDALAIGCDVAPCLQMARLGSFDLLMRCVRFLAFPDARANVVVLADDSVWCSLEADSEIMSALPPVCA
jgi:hypothetical protein